MKNIERLALIKECLYYVLGIILIAGFVFLYWTPFKNIPGPPAQRYIMTNFGDKICY